MPENLVVDEESQTARPFKNSSINPQKETQRAYENVPPPIPFEESKVM